MKIKYITIIPARGGSTRLSGKNLKPLAGIPLVLLHTSNLYPTHPHQVRLGAM